MEYLAPMSLVYPQSNAMDIGIADRATGVGGKPGSRASTESFSSRLTKVTSSTSADANSRTMNPWVAGGL